VRELLQHRNIAWPGVGGDAVKMHELFDKAGGEAETAIVHFHCNGLPESRLLAERTGIELCCVKSVLGLRQRSLGRLKRRKAVLL